MRIGYRDTMRAVETRIGDLSAAAVCAHAQRSEASEG